jgi:hypothetical protein
VALSRLEKTMTYLLIAAAIVAVAYFWRRELQRDTGMISSAERADLEYRRDYRLRD